MVVYDASVKTNIDAEPMVNHEISKIGEDGRWERSLKPTIVLTKIMTTVEKSSNVHKKVRAARGALLVRMHAFLCISV